MAGSPTNVRVWDTADVYVFDPDVVYVEATHLPADIDEALHAAWLPAGLMLGDPGVAMPRAIDKTDLNAWQSKRYRTKYKNGKVDGNFTLLEHNDVTEDLISPEDVPSARSRRVAMVFLDPETGYTERRFTTRTADLWVSNDDHKEDVDGTPVEVSFYPDASNKIFTIQKGIPT